MIPVSFSDFFFFTLCKRHHQNTLKQRVLEGGWLSVSFAFSPSFTFSLNKTLQIHAPTGRKRKRGQVTDPLSVLNFPGQYKIHDFQSPVHIILNHAVTELDYYTYTSHSHTLFSLKPIFISFLFSVLLEHGFYSSSIGMCSKSDLTTVHRRLIITVFDL